MLIPLLFAAASAATLTIPLPDGCTPVLSGSTITCPSTPQPPPVTPPGPSACAPLNLRLVDSAWPSTGNVISYTGQWGAQDAMVVRFVAPASGTAVLQLSNLGPPYGMRHSSLSTTPCGGALLAGGYSQSPSVLLTVGTKPGFVSLTPGVVYYWTVTNRNPDGSNSCLQASCSMRVDFNKAQ